MPGEGPLVGLAAGLRALRDDCDAAFAVGCDVPFLDQRVIGWLAGMLEGFDLVMPRAGGVLQPMAALYRVSVLPEVEALIAAGERSPREHGGVAGCRWFTSRSSSIRGGARELRQGRSVFSRA